MQVISEQMIEAYPNRIINIHHSFLPAFVGAKPYHIKNKLMKTKVFTLAALLCCASAMYLSLIHIFKSSMNALSTGASNPFERTQFMKYFSSKE